MIGFAVTVACRRKSDESDLEKCEGIGVVLVGRMDVSKRRERGSICSSERRASGCLAEENGSEEGEWRGGIVPCMKR